MSSTKSINLLQDYFSAKGYSFEPMVLGQSPQSRFLTMRSPDGNYITFSASGLCYPFAATAGGEIAANKIKGYDLATLLDITIPATHVTLVEAYDTAQLQGMLDAHPKLIVKPHNSLQSRGLTTNITDLSGLKRAIKHSASISPIALVQQQVSGEELRFISVDGAIRSVLLRQKPFVTGNGTATLADLIGQENKARLAITDSVVDYPQLDKTLVAQELLTSNRVPADGERVELNTKTMIRDGASIYDVLATVHPSYIAMAQRLLERFGKGLIAADFIIQDYTQPAQAHNYAMIEMNSAIALSMCYSCRDGKHFKIIEDYLGPMIEKAIA